MRYLALAIAAAALMLPAPAARAIPMTFGGILSGANEVPPNNSPGAGTVTVVLDPTAETIQISNFLGGELRTQLLPLGVPVPAPIVGAGLPGLILACGALLALGRRRRQLVV
jgi:hypothetical protein